jgi:hypothetical protein
MHFQNLKSHFLPDNKNRQLFPFFVAWVIGLIGVGMGFLASAFSWRLLAIISFVIVVGAVLFGFGWVLWSSYSLIFRNGWRKNHQEYLDELNKLKAKQPWE